MGHGRYDVIDELKPVILVTLNCFVYSIRVFIRAEMILDSLRLFTRVIYD